MWGIAVMAVAVLGVVYIFMNMCLQRMVPKQYEETYNIELCDGFENDSVKVYINDSLIYNKVVARDSIKLPVRRFDENSVLMVVDAKTDIAESYNLSQQGEDVTVSRNKDKKIVFTKK